MTPREKILDRFLKLHRLAASKNEHEAARAREEAARLRALHRITDAEVAELLAPPPTTRHAGDFDEALAALAQAVGQRHRCAALKARGKVFFRGRGAVEAVAEYRRVSAEIDAARRFYWASYGHCSRDDRVEAAWSRMFLSAAALAVVGANVPSRATHGADLNAIRNSISVWMLVEMANKDGRRAGTEIAAGEARAAVGAPPPMSHRPFALRPGFLLVSDCRPGNYATLFCGGKKLPPRGDLATFDDVRRAYTWVFACGAVPDGERVVFATSDRTIVGEVEAAGVRVLPFEARVARSADGEPLHVESFESRAPRLRAI